MGALDYVYIPISETRIRSSANTRAAPKIISAIPNPSPPPTHLDEEKAVNAPVYG